MNTDQVIKAKQYLVDFLRLINNRSLSTIVFSDFLKKNLEWDLRVWKKDREYLNQDTPPDIWIQYSQLVSTLDTIFDSVLNRVLKESSMDYYYFFDCLSKHVEKYKEEKMPVKGTDHYYVEHLLGNFYRTFFDKVADSPNSFHIWEFFPGSWKVTVDSIGDTKNILSLITLDKFFRWAYARISNAKEGDYDKALDDASQEMFPEVDPVRWSKLLIFTLSAFDPQNRIESVIRRPWNFGFAGRIRGFSGPANDEQSFEERMQKHMEEMDKVEKDNTFKMIVHLSKLIPVFHQTFTIANLEQFISDTKSLDGTYLSDSKEESKRRALLTIFTELLEYIKAIPRENS